MPKKHTHKPEGARADLPFSPVTRVGENPPSRTTVGRSGLSSPAMVVEIEAVAVTH